MLLAVVYKEFRGSCSHDVDILILSILHGWCRVTGGSCWCVGAQTIAGGLGWQLWSTNIFRGTWCWCPYITVYKAWFVCLGWRRGPAGVLGPGQSLVAGGIGGLGCWLWSAEHSRSVCQHDVNVLMGTAVFLVPFKSINVHIHPQILYIVQQAWFWN